MKISLKNQFGTLVGPLHTQDARHDDDEAVDRIMHGIKNSLGVLSLLDVAKIRAVLEKYVGGSSTVNGMGIARAGDASDAGARVRANVENNAKVASGYRDFWDKKNQELRDSIRR
jgi:hypothetical protein